jgi:hypothetical protein
MVSTSRRGLCLVPSRMTGAPHLARSSRDVGYHCSFPLTLDLPDVLNGQHRAHPSFVREPEALRAIEYTPELS